MDYYLENMTANCVCGSRNTIIFYQESYSQFGVIGVVFSIELVTPVKGIKIQFSLRKKCVFWYLNYNIKQLQNYSIHSLEANIFCNLTLMGLTYIHITYINFHKPYKDHIYLN